MKHIAFDLELERPNTESEASDSLLTEERIIQLGYVVFSVDPFRVYCQNSIVVNPGVSKLSGFIKKLTGITDLDIQNGVPLEYAVDTLLYDATRFETYRVLKQWGGGDQDCLKQEVGNKMDYFGRSGCNVKHLYQIYAEANGLNRSGGLKKCLRRCGLEWEGKAHNAMYDALNTAKMYDFLVNKMRDK